MYDAPYQSTDAYPCERVSLLAASVAVAVALATLATVCVVLLVYQPETQHTRNQAETHARR